MDQIILKTKLIYTLKSLSTNNSKSFGFDYWNRVTAPIQVRPKPCFGRKLLFSYLTHHDVFNHKNKQKKKKTKPLLRKTYILVLFALSEEYARKMTSINDYDVTKSINALN